MHNELDTTFDRKETIAERLLLRAAELWGVEHPDYIDPIVKLMVDVIAFELARLGGQMAHSDGKLLETLAGILVPGNWLLPRPAHVLMSAQPLEPRTQLKAKDQFYLPIKDKAVTGEETITDLFFSPLQTVELVKARLAFKVVQDSLFQAVDADQYLRTTSTVPARPGANDIWLALELPDDLLSLDQLGLHLQLPTQAQHLAPLLALTQWRSSTGTPLSAHPYTLAESEGDADDYDGQHFALRHPERGVLREIAACYRDSLFTLRAADGGAMPVTKVRYPAELADRFGPAQLERFEKPMWWLHATLPAAISLPAITQLHVELNCFPVLAKRLHTVQHRLHPGNNIVPLRLPEYGALFFVEEVSDDQGRLLQKRQFNVGATVPGTYRQHQGDLERLDKTTAAAHLAQVVRLVQEESSLFTAFGQDLMMKQLNNLRNDLDAIRKHLGPAAYATLQQRDYLFVAPPPQARNLEITYWSVEQRPFRNYLRPGMTLLPYKQVTVQPGSSRLRTSLLPGTAMPQSDEKISALRYGLLTRDRVVSKQDARRFVLHALAGMITDVQVQNGVAVSSDPRQGLVRTVDLLLQPAPATDLTETDWARLLTSLEQQLNERSVHTAAYRIRLQSPAPAPYRN